MKIAIQGETGSNSHMATVAMLGNEKGLEIIACNLSAMVMAKVVAGEVDGAVLPIENSLHGSVAEQDRKSTRLNSSHSRASRMPSSA